MLATLTRIYVFAVALISIAGLLYVYLLPPSSMKRDRDGIAHFTPPVLHLETLEPVPLSELARHYRGD